MDDIELKVTFVFFSLLQHSCSSLLQLAASSGFPQTELPALTQPTPAASGFSLLWSAQRGAKRQRHHRLPRQNWTIR